MKATDGAVVGVTIARDRIARLDPSGYPILRSGRFAQVDPQAAEPDEERRRHSLTTS